ncbi:MAG: hypothetical protein D6754_16335 [Alphaproteobacteria bacterium]|nr:MAG: hypothetical protein D6754_16335 [Alphaproteobacteria bacterium]
MRERPAVLEQDVQDDLNSSDAGDGVLRRKISGARVSRPPIPRIEEIGEDFAKLLDDRLRRYLVTITSTIILGCEVKKLARVLEAIEVPAMLGVIEVRGAPVSALVNISNDLLYHIVDLRLGGDSEVSPVPAARSITVLDCALCASFVEVMLDAFAEALSVNLGIPGIQPMTFSKFEQHVNMARIAPENADVLVINASLDIGEAARSGEFDLIIPLSALDTFKAASSRQPKLSSKATDDLWSQRMVQAAAEAPVRMSAIIHRLHLDIAAIEAWKPGEVLPIPGSARERVELVIPGQEATPLATGRLGAMEEMKAVKLTQPPHEELRAALARVIRLG